MLKLAQQRRQLFGWVVWNGPGEGVANEGRYRVAPALAAVESVVGVGQGEGGEKVVNGSKVRIKSVEMCHFFMAAAALPEGKRSCPEARKKRNMLKKGDEGEEALLHCAHVRPPSVPLGGGGGIFCASAVVIINDNLFGVQHPR